MGKQESCAQIETRWIRKYLVDGRLVYQQESCMNKMYVDNRDSCVRRERR